MITSFDREPADRNCGFDSAEPHLVTRTIDEAGDLLYGAHGISRFTLDRIAERLEQSIREGAVGPDRNLAIHIVEQEIGVNFEDLTACVRHYIADIDSTKAIAPNGYVEDFSTALGPDDGHECCSSCGRSFPADDPDAYVDAEQALCPDCTGAAREQADRAATQELAR